MFKKTKFYVIAGLLLIVGLILLLNKVLTVGFIIVGIGALIFCIWEFFLKEKVKQFEILNQKLLDKDEENKRLRDTVEDYSKRKLNISEINTVLELGLFEVKTNFKRTVNRKFKIQEKNVQFIGVIDVDFTAKYGVDFRKLRFKIDEGSKEIFLTNANPEFLAFTRRSCNWEIDEILEYNIPFLGTGHWRTNPNLDNPANKIKEEIRLQVEHDSENGPEELKWVIEPLRNHVERALQLILGAQGYKIRFTELDEDNYKSFQEYADENKLEKISASTNNKYRSLGG
jgi:hypothetical protein